MKYSNSKVGVLLGGMSSEREVSFSTGRAVIKALISKGYDVVEIDAQQDLPEVLTKEGVQVVYNALHGKWGEDGCIQGLLEVMKIPYTGSSVTSSAVSMDKEITNVLIERAGLTVPKTEIALKSDGAARTASDIGAELPVVVKPATEGSSVGISIVKAESELSDALKEAFRWDERVLVQQYIKGREVTIAVVDDVAMGTVEVRPKLDFYNYKAKYTKGMTEYISPAPLDAETEKVLLESSVSAGRALGCQGAIRVDFIISENGTPYFLEVNTLPGLTELSLVPMAAKSAGLTFEDLVEKVLSGATLKMGS